MTLDEHIARLDHELDTLWAQLQKSLKRGDWATYWNLRRSWLSIGRLHSILIQQRAQERSAQLSLIPPSAGRHHDRAVS